VVLLHDTPVASAVQPPPIVGELQAAFAALDDAPLLDALTGPTRRGPKGHPAATLWRCFVAKHVLGLESTAELIRTLENNPFIAGACGVTGAIPHKSTFSRFFTKLTKRKYLHLVKDVSRSLVRQHYATLPGFGKRVALDSSTLKAWSNGGKKPHYSDMDAGWSIKKGTHGAKEFTYGYKLHLLVDAEYELPIAAHVSTGNVHDSVRASNVLAEARKQVRGFRPRYIMADKGYSSKAFLALVHRQYRSTPVVDLHPSHKRLRETHGETMATPEWKALYRQRQSVERAFSRLKGQRSLNHIRVRRLRKVTLHCYLSLIALQARHAQRPVCADAQVVALEGRTRTAATTS
jgi:transposase